MELWEAKTTHGTASILDLWMVTEILGDDTDAGNKGSTCPIYLIYLSPILSIIYHLYFYFSPPSSQLAMTQFTKRKPVWNYKKRFWHSKSHSPYCHPCFWSKTDQGKKGAGKGYGMKIPFAVIKVSNIRLPYYHFIWCFDLVLIVTVQCRSISDHLTSLTGHSLAWQFWRRASEKWHQYIPYARENILFVCKWRTAGELKISCLYLSKYCKGIPGNRERKTWGYQRLERWFN